MDFGNVPVGFAMALAQNQAAMEKYALMAREEKQTVLDQAHDARSKREMQQIVASIAESI